MEATSGNTFETATEPAEASTEAPTVTLRVITHLIGSFDPSEEGVPVIAREGSKVPSDQADALIAKAAEHGVTVEKVGA